VPFYQTKIFDRYKDVIEELLATPRGRPPRLHP
jgi:hypothetical protein